MILTLFFLGFATCSYSQIEEPTDDFWKHVRFGGGLGLSFGDGFFSGTVAPSAIYQFNSRFAAGVGLNFTYNKQDDFFRSTIFGGSTIGLFNPIPELQLSSEFEMLNVNRKFENSTFENDTYWYPALFMGLGYRTNNITVGIRYDLLYDRDKSIYADPWAPFFRVFF